jgi:hypothetical protein
MSGLPSGSFPFEKFLLSPRVLAFDPKALHRASILDIEPVVLILVRWSRRNKRGEGGTVGGGKEGGRRSTRRLETERRRSREGRIRELVRRRDR